MYLRLLYHMLFRHDKSTIPTELHEPTCDQEDAHVMQRPSTGFSIINVRSIYFEERVAKALTNIRIVSCSVGGMAAICSGVNVNTCISIC
jgi:hypothetical protein